MKRFGLRSTLAAAAALVFAVTATALPAFAATGIAWDQVTRFSMDGSVPQPNFGPDFQAASQPAPQRGGMFGGMTNAMAAMGHMLQSGIAERHYVAGNLRRTDQVAEQTATIVNCGARTITYLDLGKKTYRVVSMDQPTTPSSGGSSPRGNPSQP
ncbi:MAG: hypothetical protein JO359_14810, partial [Candidatus Eremiobacteraeota bacterium]|nr:hypothetical protein [Candidatus Eremiobacteraeota bacterium]